VYIPLHNFYFMMSSRSTPIRLALKFNSFFSSFVMLALLLLMNEKSLDTFPKSSCSSISKPVNGLSP
jgi:hypothetical protein